MASKRNHQYRSIVRQFLSSNSSATAEKKEKVAKIQSIWNWLNSEHDNRLSEGYATF